MRIAPALRGAVAGVYAHSPGAEGLPSSVLFGVLFLAAVLSVDEGLVCGSRIGCSLAAAKNWPTFGNDPPLELANCW